MLQLPFIFCEIVIITQKFKKTVIFQIDGFRNLRIYPYTQYVELPGLAFETSPSSKIAILTTFFRKNENIGVQILPTVPTNNKQIFKIFAKTSKNAIFEGGGYLKNPHGFLGGSAKKPCLSTRGEGDQKCPKICPHGL